MLMRSSQYRWFLSGAMLLVLVLWCLPVFRATAQTQQQSGNINVNAIVPGPPPSEPAVITNPQDGQHFTEIPIPVSGTCADNTIVRIYRNGVFVGSTPCQPDKTFSLLIDLVPGQNVLTARNFDTLDQAGPDSPAITVFYDIPTVPVTMPAASTPQTATTPGGSRGTASGGQGQPGLLLTNDGLPIRGIVYEPTTLTFHVEGGTSPYAISIDWGDGNSQLVSQPGAGDMQVRHTYEHAGNFRVILRATDTAGRKAYLELAVEVWGQNQTIDVASPLINSGLLDIIWILAIGILAIIIAFWLGERFELYKQHPHHK